MKTARIELNEQFKKALEVMEQASGNIFVTGKAGTGKSTLLDYFRKHTRQKIAVLAPTGVAALNVCGETIHSFFGFKPDITLDKVKKLKGSRGRIYKEIDAIVIDEVSMVRADLLDCVDKFLRLNARESRKAFGGVRMFFFGDLYQLPPVVTAKERGIFSRHYDSHYFFAAQAFREIGSPELIELDKIYRQTDPAFIQLLNVIRNNSVTDADLLGLNQRVGAKLLSPAPRKKLSVYLTTTNQRASQINAEYLGKLKAKIHTYDAQIDGDFKEQSYPTDCRLALGVGAQVMLLNNDSQGRWVNGSIGQVADIRNNEDKDDSVFVRFCEGGTVEVLPYAWEIFHFSFNADTSQIETESLGSFTQYPLRLAWAITIHKSQGKTFERVIIDMGRGSFAHGQTYVALSRCRSLEGISLVRPIRKSDIFMDWRIVKFMTGYQYALSERNMPLEEKVSAIKQAIKSNSRLEITYLKATDEKSRRIVKPLNVGTKVYLDKEFLGLEAYCTQRRENRVFRVDRILELKVTADS